MGKAEQLAKTLGANIAESTSTGRAGGPPSAIPARRVDPKEVGVGRAKEVKEIELDRIVPDPDQPRKHFDPEAMETLSVSLKERGQMQPIRVRWSESLGLYTIISGERRYRGAMMAGLKTLTCVVSTTTNPIDVLADQLIENIVRENLDPMEEAEGFKQMMDMEGLSQRALAELLGISQGRVAQRVALLDLPEPIREQVAREELAPSSAYLISTAPKEAQVELAAEAAGSKLSRAEVQERVDRANQDKPSKAGGPKKSTARADKAAGLVAVRKIKTDAKIKITAERTSPFDRAALLAALRQAAEIVAAEIEEPALAGAD